MNYRPVVFVSAFGVVLMAGTVNAQGPLVGSTLDQLFYALDGDHDGVIERDEARASPLLSTYFAEADSNADDGIDRVEFAVFEANSGSGGGTPYGGGGGGVGGGTVAPGTAPGAGTGTGGAPAGTPPPTSSGPAGSAATPTLPAGTPPPTSSGGTTNVPGAPPATSSGTTAGATGGTSGAAGGGTTGGTAAPGAPGYLAPRR